MGRMPALGLLASLAVTGPLGCNACGAGGRHEAALGASASEPDEAPRTVAVRVGQCGYVEPGALRGGVQSMSVDTQLLGPGVPVELDTLYVRPVTGSWACMLQTHPPSDALPPPRGPVDLGRFRMLGEERRTAGVGPAEPGEIWIWLTDPGWVSEVARLRDLVVGTGGQPGQLERLCDEAARARVDPDRLRSEAITAMRRWVATGQIEDGLVDPPPDRLDEQVREIAQACGW